MSSDPNIVSASFNALVDGLEYHLVARLGRPDDDDDDGATAAGSA